MSQAPRVRILLSETYNPWFNLATEDWIFRELDPSAQTLFLWRNDNTVVIGRNQNPWSECNLTRMEEDKVFLARRTSGGGAVFHDLGNTCFTFLSAKEGYNKTANITILLDALSRLGVTAQASGRNDLVIPLEDGPRKISGSAYRETKDRAFHHGTFLIGADLTRLSNYLTPHPKKLESKGSASVRSRVMNIRDLRPEASHEALVKAMIGAFCDFHGATAEPELLEPSFLEGQPSLKRTFEHYASWDWRFGNAPRFSHQMVEYLSWGFFEVHVDAENGHITRAQVFSDALYPDLVQDLQAALVGKPHSRNGVQQAVAEARSRHPAQERELGELEAWLMGQVEV
ncbi:lipoate--protein ligase [Corallococcus sp. CA047B]|uniref:lipoate--protein ligase n=1 Tax=Corallococcus sp. CA047B TaxID=2316729 RepID=UPI000EA408DE|nr:lipoate--protein ligase [Corallococcus sp. CA047B]RKH21409.1 lipoate--protein ligase [Corallococcus sp. CA047B]